MKYIFIVSIFFIPSFLQITLNLDSRTNGLLMCILPLFFYQSQFIIKQKINLTLIYLFLSILFWSIMLLPFSLEINYPFKFFGSLLLMLIFILFINFVYNYYILIPNENLLKLLKFSIGILFLTGLTYKLFKLPFSSYNGYYDSVLFFAEPSHFARIFGPLICISFFIFKSQRYHIIIFSLLFSIYLLSTSLLFYTILPILISISLKKIKILFFTLTALIISFYIIAQMNDIFIYFASRLTLTTLNNNNITSLVFIQGLEAIKCNFIDTFGFGIGFQMLGNEKPNFVSFIIEDILGPGKYVSRTDGGFVAAKLISELGYLGILFVIIFLKYFFKSYKFLNKIINNDFNFKTDLKNIIAASFICSYSIELFIRGGGYFSITTFFTISSILYLQNAPK